MAVIVKCETCGKEYETIPYFIQKNKHFYCSRECYRNAPPRRRGEQKERKIFKCAMCDKEVKLQPCRSKLVDSGQNKNVFCSPQCKHEFYLKGNNNPNYNGGLQVSICEHCGKVFMVRPYEVGKRKYCSQQCHGLATLDKMPNSFTKPERMVKDFLDKLNINYIFQYEIDNKYRADFYLPDTNIILEVYGDFWHANPRKYGDGEGLYQLRKTQLDNIKRDHIRMKYIEDAGYNTIIIWECDIYDDIEQSMSFLFIA